MAASKDISKNKRKEKELSDDELSLGISSDDATDAADAQDDMLEGIDLNLSSDEYEDDGPIVFWSDEEYEDEGENDDDDDYDFREALRLAGNFKNKKKKTSSSKNYWKRKMIRSTARDLDPEVRMNLSLANEAFVRHDLQVALNLYLEVIKKDPKNFNAYKTLGEIYKSQNKLHECCNYWLLAANIHPWDSFFWANVAELSAELGYTDQAIYCYTRAIASDSNKTPEFTLERAILYKDKKQYGRALEGFQKLHLQFPTDASIIKNLASVYVEQKRLNDAINLYMDILDKNMNATEKTKGLVPEFGWTELNILCEIYISQHTYTVGIKTIKLVARWLQNRESEEWWNETENFDLEFDERRHDILELRPLSQREMAYNKPYDLPIDIRFKLGILRLGLNHKDEALFHFDYLLDETDDISDLHFEAGKSLEAQGYNEEALQFLNRAYENEEERTLELLELMAKCYLEVGQWLQAKSIYTTLIHEDPNNLDMKLALIEALFHLDEVDAASDLLKEVSKSAKATGITEPEQEEDDPLPLIKNTDRIKSAKNPKLSIEEKAEIEENARRKVLDKFHALERLQAGIAKEDSIAAVAWIKLASQLVEMFMGVRSFFPKDKNRTFKGILLYKRKKQMGLDEKLARVYNLYEGMTETDESEKRHELTAVNEYRGLNYDQWFFIFVQYALLLHKYENNIEYASQIIEIAQNVSVFIQDKNRGNVMKFISLILGLSQGDCDKTLNNIRHFLISNQFSQYICKIFLCCFPSGIVNWSVLSNYNHQKFFLRQLKAFDASSSSQNISGMATITATKNIPRSFGNLELLYVYANLLGGARSYTSSIVYLTKAYKAYSQDPLLCFVLGLGHVHRAMQRMSTNRHIQLLQGMSYLLEYKEIREKGASDYELQEVEFNFGRLFHMLGLPSIAINHYEKALSFQDKLEDSDYDLLMEAAHNLSLIYIYSGNTALARKITERYLTI